MSEDGITARVLAQNVHTFDELPDKMQRLWREEWGESTGNELFLVVCADSGDAFVFGEQGKAFGLQVCDGSRWLTRIGYEILNLPLGDALDESGEVRATFNLTLNEPLVDSREESWVEAVTEELSALADKGPHKEDNGND